MARARGQKLPPGYIIDKNGNPSIDPEDYYQGGAGLPMGGPVGYKGFGLAMVVDITAGLLSTRGAAYLGDEVNVAKACFRWPSISLPSGR
jgi:LDH2 family malate/lactate/ureidoglycolate dehydrogenase